jgi:alkanesulfonate monooxygenase SsuD/methylene tetrahydromethanopterin reductase-like flavin-dependent oxidoreductase (luciferase family)
MPKPADDRPLYFSAFVMNTPSHVIHGLWRDPEAANHEINSLSHWVELARYLDGAGYDLMFFADVTGLRSPWMGHTSWSPSRACRSRPTTRRC